MRALAKRKAAKSKPSEWGWMAQGGEWVEVQRG